MRIYRPIYASLPALLLWIGISQTAANAGSVSYTYTGFDFTNINNVNGNGTPLPASDYITVTITLSNALQADQPYSQLHDLIGWTISDQSTSLSSNDPDVLYDYAQLFIATAGGIITNWEFSAAKF